MLLRGGRIAGIGPEASLVDRVDPTAQRVDLEGGFVLPGFIDAHVHLLDTGLSELGWRVDLSGLSRAGALERIEAAARNRGDGEWLVAVGWDESQWDDAAYLTRAELDRVAPRSATLAVRMDCHLVVLNSEALRRVLDDVLSAHDAALVDVRTGAVREAAAWAMMDHVEPDQRILADAVRAVMQRCHRLGITSVHTMTPAARVPVLLSARVRQGLRITVYQKVASAEELRAVVPPDRFDETWTRFGGVKIFADGSLGAQNAALQQPYCAGGIGALNHSDDALRDILRRADAAGWQTAVHAIGDRAIAQVVDAHEVVGTQRSHRHRLEHVELMTEEQLGRIADLGLCLSMQPNFIGNWSGPSSMYVERIGVERDERSNPLAHVAAAGIPLAFGSDGMPMSPLYGIASAVGAPYEGQRLGVQAALDGYTKGGAYLGFEERRKGVLRVGSCADLVVLDDDPRNNPGGVNERRVRATFVDGVRVYAEDGVR